MGTGGTGSGGGSVTETSVDLSEETFAVGETVRDSIGLRSRAPPSQ